MPKNYFDERVAAEYETRWPDLFAPEMVEPAVAFLEDHAHGGPILELGIGTGRLALPLAARGLEVHGIELSPAMIAEMRRKDGGNGIGVTVGDMASAAVGSTFTLAYLVRNTIMNLTTQDAQVECFANVARHLRPGGSFVIEVLVPALQRLPPGESVQPFDVSESHLGFDEYDLPGQGLISHHYWLHDSEVEYFAAPFRYVWPSELDLMARMNGFTLAERWSDWDRQPFTAESHSHISVWRRL
jgi:SAM-dependent methyltransferase